MPTPERGPQPAHRWQDIVASSMDGTPLEGFALEQLKDLFGDQRKSAGDWR